MKRRLGLPWIILLGLPALAYAASDVRIPAQFAYPYFAVDYASFKADSGRTYVEVYVQLSYTKIKFVKTESGFVGTYEIEVTIHDGAGQVKSRTFPDTVRVSDYEATISPEDYRMSLMSFLLSPGAYQCHVSLRERESRIEYFSAFNFVAPAYSGEALELSNIQFSRKIQPAGPTESPFIKNGRLIEPNPSAAFGFFTSRMYAYYEIYGLQAGSDSTTDFVLANFVIKDADGKVCKRLRQKTAKPGRTCVHSVLLPIGDLAAGQYLLEVEVVDPRSGMTAAAAKGFVVGWELLNGRDETFADLIDQLSIIASQTELESLRKLPKKYQRAGLLSYWMGKDPSPGTPENELMREFYDRIAYANRTFAFMSEAGWRSDQGQIYVRYGPPDSVVKSLYGAKKKPCEIWQYHQLQQEFVFVDNKGYGDYVLVQPLTMFSEE